jgi:transposase-like protein
MHSVKGERRSVKGREKLAEAMQQVEARLLLALAQQFNAILVEVVSYLLGREFHERRRAISGRVEQEGYCQRCRSHQSRRFVRNGYRRRTLLTPLGWVAFWLPRVRCECGGSVQLCLEGWLRPYQRVSDLVDEQVRRWYRLGVSLRQMQEVLSHSVIGPLSLQTLLKRIHQCEPGQGVEGVPPIMQVDAIWVTQVLPNGEVRIDRKGRRRACKGRYKRPIFIALGVWPESDQARVLEWMLAESEEIDAWTHFLTRLEETGIRGEAGLRLLIHDGGSGLCGALQTVHFGVPTQRCLFHKLRNIAQALQLPTGVSRRERSRQRKAILKRFQEIWQAQRLATALRRYRQVVRDFRHSHPDAVATLRRDFRATLSFYSLADIYPRHHLCTTSRLERFNRTLRSRLRPAVALHSDAGLVALISQQVATFNAIPISTI